MQEHSREGNNRIWNSRSRGVTQLRYEVHHRKEDNSEQAHLQLCNMSSADVIPLKQ